MTESDWEWAMRSNHTAILFTGFMILLAACGILGEKDPTKKLVEYGANQGCLNDFGKDAEKFLAGEVDPEAWKKGFDCAKETLETFQKFAKGQTDNGFGADDLHALVSNVLITNSTVPKELITSSLELKASILGGSPHILTREELTKILNIIDTVKNESLELIAHLKNRIEKPSPANMQDMLHAIEKFTSKVSVWIGEENGHALKLETANTLVASLNQAHKWDLDLEWVKLVFGAKVFFVGGSSESIESIEWRRLAQTASAVGGGTLAYISMVKTLAKNSAEGADFRETLISSAKLILENSVAWSGGGISYKNLFKLIDDLPGPWLKANREVIKTAFPTLIKKLLDGEHPERIEQKSFDLLFSLVMDWHRSQKHLDIIFDAYNLNNTVVTSAAFIAAAQDYRKSLDLLGQFDVNRLIDMASFKPMFQEDDHQITYLPGLNNSLNNLTKINALNLAAKHLIRSYSTVPLKQAIIEADLVQIFTDIKDAAFEFKILDNMNLPWPKKRFFEGDMFTYESNGDGFLDTREATYLATAFYSISKLTDRMLKNLIPICKDGTGHDNLGSEWMDLTCFREEFYGNVAEYFDHFPNLYHYYINLNEADRTNFIKSLEKGSRRYGVTNLPIASFDTINLAGVLHYIENVFARFDGNTNQLLDKDEILQAYPVFKRKIEIIGNGKLKTDGMTKAAFTYLIKYGKPPADGLWGTVHFVAWMLAKPFWSFEADRGRIFEIVSYFNEPEPLPKDL